MLTLRGALERARRVPWPARVVMLLTLGVLVAVLAIRSTDTKQSTDTKRSTDTTPRHVPFGFFGTVLDPSAADLAFVSDSALDSQMALMARSGVESLRVTFAWNAIEAARGAYDWRSPDRLITDAARHGISLLVNIVDTPAWASRQPSSLYSYRFAPTSPQLFADFATKLVQRYGPHGAFWAFHPGIGPVPVREWQIWNEQGFNVFWASQPWPEQYTQLLRPTYQAIHHADPGAQVVAGSLVAVPGETQWGQAGQLYRAGAKPYFDVISVHPFTIDRNSVSGTVNRAMKIVRYVRDVMRQNGDGEKPIIVTELSWPGAVGSVAPSRLLGLETTPQGEVLRLSAAYEFIAKHLRETGITQAYWYTWASTFNASDSHSDVGFRFAGLTRFAGGAFSIEPALNVYAQVAASFEGCRKSADAKVCA